MKPAVRAILYVIFALAGAMAVILMGTQAILHREANRAVAVSSDPGDSTRQLAFLIGMWIIPETVLGASVGMLLAWVLFRRCAVRQQ